MISRNAMRLISVLALAAAPAGLAEEDFNLSW